MRKRTFDFPEYYAQTLETISGNSIQTGLVVQALHFRALVTGFATFLWLQHS